MSELIFNRILLEKYNQTLSIILIISVSLNLFLAVIVLGVANKPTLMVYSEEGSIGVLKSKNFKVDEGLLEDFTKMMVGQYLNFTSTSLPQQIDGISQYLSVKAKQAVLDAYKHNQLTIEKEGIGQQFVVSGIQITKKNNPYWVEISGQRTLYVNGNNKTVPITYIFEIKKIKPNESNPYGLMLNDVIQKKETSV